ncbi:Sec-independent protein translocase protein TatB [Stakelama tenebrarum]|uniref:Twin-arginine translocase subunit TatB n=1 Tax=Stakelama tenebrarum TaxID=2711215 RepID=A0A6G6Y529_9SPHN|nr:Sec-independent protein translocase protein TatB [Sphingosinithalassobacter tenebrarum]QIG79828.1 twin-arginine translocase subunit TatB [Sphingosinithalassobacter tenebrarum]
MFSDIGWSELLMVGFIALIVIGPKDLPKAMRFAGQWVGKARGVARQFRSGFDAMVREAELAEMEKKWAEENARIMREHPMQGSLPGPDGEVAPPAAPQPAAEPAPPPASQHVADEDAPPVMTERPVVHEPPQPEASETAPPANSDKPGS